MESVPLPSRSPAVSTLSARITLSSIGLFSPPLIIFTDTIFCQGQAIGRHSLRLCMPHCRHVVHFSPALHQKNGKSPICVRWGPPNNHHFYLAAQRLHDCRFRDRATTRRDRWSRQHQTIATGAKRANDLECSRQFFVFVQQDPDHFILSFFFPVLEESRHFPVRAFHGATWSSYGRSHLEMGAGNRREGSISSRDGIRSHRHMPCMVWGNTPRVSSALSRCLLMLMSSSPVHRCRK